MKGRTKWARCPVCEELTKRTESLYKCDKCGQYSKPNIDGGFTIYEWPPAHYKEALRMQGIDVEKMLKEKGGIVDFNLTGDNTTVIHSLSEYRRICKERGLIGEVDEPDYARDLRHKLTRKPVFFDMGKTSRR